MKVPQWSLALPLPAEGDVYEYCFRAADQQWVHWLDTVPAVTPDPKSEFSSIIVQARPRRAFISLSFHSAHVYFVLCLRAVRAVLCALPASVRLNAAGS